MKIGYTAGVWDLLHVGHINILRNCKAMCDKLIVAVSTDQLIEEVKSKTPVIKFEERCEVIRAIKYVDVVVPQEDYEDKLGAWKRYKFDVMFVGDDWHSTLKWKQIEEEFKKIGVKIIYLPYTKGVSSTKINMILEKERKEGK